MANTTYASNRTARANNAARKARVYNAFDQFRAGNDEPLLDLLSGRK